MPELQQADELEQSKNYIQRLL